MGFINTETVKKTGGSVKPILNLFDLALERIRGHGRP